MRGLVVCIAIYCLSHVSGAPTDEEGKTFFKSYNFDNADLIDAAFPVWEDEVVFAVCEGSDADKKCKVYMESANPEKTAQSCDLNLTYSGKYISNVALYNAGNSKAIFAVGDGDSTIKLISVNLKGCQINETSLQVVKENPQIPVMSFAFEHIIPHEKNYDLFFQDNKLCADRVCKATYDYEGNLVKAAIKLHSFFDGYDQIAYANNAYIIAYRNVFQRDLIDILLVKDEDLRIVTHITSIEIRGNWFALTADDNKIGVCTHGDGKVLCKQQHVEGYPRLVQVEFPFDYQRGSFQALDVLNLEKGFLQLSVDTANLFNVTHFDEAGKQGKSVRVDAKCDKNYVLLPKLYKNTNGQYCVNSICMLSLDNRNRSKFSIANRCFLKTELI